MERILVVDDEKDICDILQFNLEKEGFVADVAYSGEAGLSQITDEHSLILLDVMMGGISGFKMAELLREQGNTTPIIFLTAKNTESDILKGFSIGGDDYIAKPFSIKEVIARVKAVLNRNAMKKSTSVSWTIDGLSVDMSSNRVTIDGEEIPLTKKEFEILVLLIQSSPNVLTRSDILNQVWSDNEYVLDRTVDVHITRLRKKLKNYSSIIANRSGFGYYLNPEGKNE